MSTRTILQALALAILALTVGTVAVVALAVLRGGLGA